MLASHSCSLLVFSKNRHSELNSERKLELTVLAFKNVIVINFSPNWRSSNTDTPHDTTHFNTFILVMCTDIRWLSIINCLLIAKKEMSGYLKQMFIAFVIKLFNMWTFLFSLFYHTYSHNIHTRYNCDTEQTYSFWEETVYTPVILFQEYIKLCTKHCCFLQLYFYLSMLFQ